MKKSAKTLTLDDDVKNAFEDSSLDRYPDGFRNYKYHQSFANTGIYGFAIAYVAKKAMSIEPEAFDSFYRRYEFKQQSGLLLNGIVTKFPLKALKKEGIYLPEHMLYLDEHDKPINERGYNHSNPVEVKIFSQGQTSGFAAAGKNYYSEDELKQISEIAKLGYTPFRKRDLRDHEKLEKLFEYGKLMFDIQCKYQEDAVAANNVKYTEHAIMDSKAAEAVRGYIKYLTQILEN